MGGHRQAQSLGGSPHPLTEAPEGNQKSLVKLMGGGVLVFPAEGGRSSSAGPPAWDRPACWGSRSTSSRERERKY